MSVNDSASPQLEDIRQVSSGWINKYVLTYELPDGTRYEYESASRKKLDDYCRSLEGRAAGAAPTADAVCIVPQTADGTLLLIREFRYPLNSWVVGLPAGLVEPGEDLAVAVDRELREETGYGLRTDIPEGAVELLPQAGHSSTGMSDESVQTVFAQVEKDEAAHPEHGELIEVFTLPLREVPRFLKQNPLPLGTRLQLVLEIFARNAK